MKWQEILQSCLMITITTLGCMYQLPDVVFNLLMGLVALFVDECLYVTSHARIVSAIPFYVLAIIDYFCNWEKIISTWLFCNCERFDLWIRRIFRNIGESNFLLLAIFVTLRSIINRIWIGSLYKEACTFHLLDSAKKLIRLVNDIVSLVYPFCFLVIMFYNKSL